MFRNLCETKQKTGSVKGSTSLVQSVKTLEDKYFILSTYNQQFGVSAFNINVLNMS